MTEQKEKFAPKQPVQLLPPKYDPISVEELSKHDGTLSFCCTSLSHILFLIVLFFFFFIWAVDLSGVHPSLNQSQCS